MAPNTTNDVIRVFHNRNYNSRPRPVVSMQHNAKLQKIALNRGLVHSIEIWDIKHLPFLERTLPAPHGHYIRALTWSGTRLFSIGAKSVPERDSGAAIKTLSVLTEWDWRQKLQPLREQHLTGNTALCLDANAAATELAVGTAEGYINIFSVTGKEELSPKRLYDRLGGKVFCCKYDQTGEFLVTGSEGVIQLWNTSTGQALHKFKVRYERYANVNVLCVSVLSDLCIVAGDSTGQLSIWDGQQRARLQLIKVLDGVPLLTVNAYDSATEASEQVILCAGREPKVHILAKTQRKRDDMSSTCWLLAMKRAVHTRDIHAALYANSRVYSAGVDGYLCVSGALKRIEQAKYGPFMSGPCAMTAANAQLLLLRLPDSLQLYRLAQPQSAADDDEAHVDRINGRRAVPMAKPESQLLVLEPKRGQLILSAAISADGRFICYATQYATRLFSFTIDESGNGEHQLTPITELSEVLLPATQLRFSANSKYLYALNATQKKLLICKVGEDFDLVDTIELEKEVRGPPTHFVLSDCARFFVIASADHAINVWRRFGNGKSYRHHLQLPRHTAGTTAIALNAKRPFLVAAYADGKLIEYDLEELCFTCSSSNSYVPSSATHCTLNILSHPWHDSRYLLHNEVHFFSLEKVPPVIAEEAPAKKAKRGQKKEPAKLETEQKLDTLALKTQLNFDYLLVHLDRLKAGEIVLVGVEPATLLQHLPPIGERKKFGVS